MFNIEPKQFSIGDRVVAFAETKPSIGRVLRKIWYDERGEFMLHVVPDDPSFSYLLPFVSECEPVDQYRGKR